MESLSRSDVDIWHGPSWSRSWSWRMYDSGRVSLSWSGQLMLLELFPDHCDPICSEDLIKTEVLRSVWWGGGGRRWLWGEARLARGWSVPVSDIIIIIIQSFIEETLLPDQETNCNMCLTGLLYWGLVWNSNARHLSSWENKTRWRVFMWRKREMKVGKISFPYNIILISFLRLSRQILGIKFWNVSACSVPASTPKHSLDPKLKVSSKFCRSEDRRL